MKKILPILFAAASLLVSCHKSSPNDPMLYYRQWYDEVSNVNDLVLDPFNISYRLEVYLNATKAAPSRADALRQSLFGGAAIASADQKSYTITYNTLETTVTQDLNREGAITIHTYGVSLTDPGAVWTVEIPESEQFMVGMVNFGLMEIRVDDGAYRIEALSASKWKVTAVDYYMLMASNHSFALWDLMATVTQTKGAPVESDLATAEFALETLPGVPIEGSNFSRVYTRYVIESPVLYQASCGFQSKGGGKEALYLLDTSLKNTDTLTVDRGTTFVCGGPVTFTHDKTDYIYYY
ncbi:MAG: hypothetical protein LBU80_03815 [Rikenellaceae bacterium]|jgi:hypothetical protein|nr:hypothetical protein [Rikenellaceae bacterium]